MRFIALKETNTTEWSQTFRLYFISTVFVRLEYLLQICVLKTFKNTSSYTFDKLTLNITAGISWCQIYSAPVKGPSVFVLLVFSSLTGFQVSAESKTSIRPDSLSLLCHRDWNEMHGTALLSFSSPCHIIRQVWKSIIYSKKGEQGTS